MDIRTLRAAPQDSNPIYTIPNSTITFTLWLEFEWWEPQTDDDSDTNFCNIQIRFSDDRHYALNVWTYNYFTVARQADTRSGDNLNGMYLLPPDLFVVRLDRQYIATVIYDLVQRDRICSWWQIPRDTSSTDITKDQEDPIFAKLVAQSRGDGFIQCKAE